MGDCHQFFKLNLVEDAGSIPVTDAISVWRRLASAFAWGAKGRGFKSLYADQFT